MEHVPIAPVAPVRLSQAAFTALVERHQRPLHAFLGSLADSPEHARDLVQDTFHDAWRAAQAETPPFVRSAAEDEVRRWLFHAAYCKAVSALRRRTLIRWESLDAAHAPLSPTLEAIPSFEDRLAEGDALRAALAALSQQDAACILLRVVQGFSAAEVGQIVGATPEVVTKRLSRAKQRLRTAYLASHDGRKERERP